LRNGEIDSIKVVDQNTETKQQGDSPAAPREPLWRVDFRTSQQSPLWAFFENEPVLRI